MKHLSLIIFLLVSWNVSVAQVPIDTLGKGSNPPLPLDPGYSIDVPTIPVYNYNTVYTPLIPMTDPAAVETGNAEVVKKIKTYKNGFNESFQSIERNINNNKHLVKFKNTANFKNQVSYLPYIANAEGIKSDPLTAQKAFYATLHPEEGATGDHALTKSMVLNSSTQRGAISFNYGKNNSGSNRGDTVIQITNAENEVRIWDFTGTGTPTSPGYYKAKALLGTEYKGIHDKRMIEYKDKDGNLILKKQLENKSTNTWIITQYIYDDMGRLVGIISPKASRLITGATVPTDVWANLCFQYYYDNKGRLSAELKPGETEMVEFVYDRKNRLVMKRNQIMKAQSKWEVTFYDIDNRIKATALLSNAESRTIWQSRIDAANFDDVIPASNLLFYLATNLGELSYPTSISGLEILSETRYDYYPSIPSELAFNSALFSAESISDVEPYNKISVPIGSVVYSKVKVINQESYTDIADWTESYNYYDVKGRNIQSRGYNFIKDGIGNRGIESSSTNYNFNNQVLISTYHHQHKKTNFEVVEVSKFEYQVGNARLLKSWHKVNDNPWKLQSKYTYDDFGRLKRKELGDNAEVQDFDYNIRGQLKGINKDYASTGFKGVFSKSFGEELFYDYGYTNPRYDGKIRGMVWRGAGGNKMHYTYNYDLLGRLLSADFNEYNTDLNAWSKMKRDHTVSNITYDANGNILTMKQRGMGLIGAEIEPVDMDELTYTYASNSNKLMRVADLVSVNYGNGDFQDGFSGEDYSYDNAGNLIEDKNKEIASITYNWNNKPTEIMFHNGSQMKYTYNAAGIKLREEIVLTGEPSKKRDYLGNKLYIDDELQHISTGEGRTIYIRDGEKYEEEYFVKDHLGNIRTIVAVEAVPFTVDYLATFELSSAYVETILFDNVNEVREDNPTLVPDNEYVSELSSETKPVGTSILLKVMPGDRVDLEVFNMYEGYDAQHDNPMSSQDLLSNILTTMLSGPGGSAAEGGSIQLIQTLFSPNNLLSFVNSAGASYDPNRPKAALNYVLYDQQMQVVQEFKGSIQVDGEGTWSKIGTDGALTIPRGGYLAVFLTNGSSLPVYFDDFRIRFTKGIVREETHYYPHGLPMGFIGGAAIDAVENRHTHQGNEYRKDAGLNWMDFNFRQYDPQLGRFLSVDPLADYYGQDRYSPYAAMGNQPESSIDPNGLMEINDSEFSANINRILNTYGARAGMNDFIERSIAAYYSKVNGDYRNGTFVAVQSMSLFKLFFHALLGRGANGGASNSIISASVAAQAIAAQAAQRSTTGQGETSGTAGNNTAQEGNCVEAVQTAKGAVPIMDYPESGMYTEGIYTYDLDAFDQFYNEYGKAFKAEKYYGKYRDAQSLSGYSNFTIDGKPSSSLYAEASSYLSVTDNGSFNKLVSVGGNTDKSKKGHSGGLDFVYPASDAFVPPNASKSATIHTHTFTNMIGYMNGTLSGYMPTLEGAGPSSDDFRRASFTIRSVMVNERYIFLYNQNGALAFRRR